LLGPGKNLNVGGDFDIPFKVVLGNDFGHSMSRSFILFILVVSLSIARAATISIVTPTNAAPRVLFGADRVEAALKSVGVEAVIVNSGKTSGQKIWLKEPLQPDGDREGFSLIHKYPGDDVTIQGDDDSGTLYGCLELAKRIRQARRVPDKLDFYDAPVMRLRGTCIGLQKTYILPGRHVYEYPITPKLFPWFYDKKLWTDYLNFLVANRMNTLYLWSGHPFASLVRLKDYPYAVEVPNDVFQKNVEMYHWLAKECDKRGIWLVQMFYNIIVSKPFAEHNHISTQLSAPTPLASDYTRQSIAEFVKDYPHVGLLVCLGEALRGTENQVEWCTNVILPGVLDGMKAAGLKQEPPIIIRTHAMNAYVVMPAAYKIYTNLYTMTKYNGESLTTWQPRGSQQAVHVAMSRLGPHIVNVHILSNLEPFRYGDQKFIKKCVQAARDRLDAIGIHLYPLSYWNWPYSPDIASPPLLQWKRDWIWYVAWARYAWNPDIPAAQDHAFWISRLAEMYGNTNAAEKILEAYDDSGECAPRILRRFGITDGNRQTMSLGMTLDELVNPGRYDSFPYLWKSESPPGERLDEYVRKEWYHQPHEGETPPEVIHEILNYSQEAVEAADAAEPLVTTNRAEFERVRNDVHCIQLVSENYAAKAQAAMLVLRYGYSHDIHDMEKAEKFLTESFHYYQELAQRTDKTYEFANSMQTSQRKIPFTGGIGHTPTNYLWSQLVPRYRKELVDFQAKVVELKKTGGHLPSVNNANVKPWPAAPFKLISTNVETYQVRIGARPFMDRSYTIQNLAPQLKGLTGIRIWHGAAKAGHYQPIEFEVSEPVRVLVGYFNSHRSIWLQVPRLEEAAQADERGGVDTVLENAARIQSCPSVNVHAFRYGPGRHKLEFIGKGSFVVLGVIPQSVPIDNTQ
jgi:hypothetical protein